MGLELRLKLCFHGIPMVKSDPRTLFLTMSVLLNQKKKRPLLDQEVNLKAPSQPPLKHKHLSKQPCNQCPSQLLLLLECHLNRLKNSYCLICCQFSRYPSNL